MSRVSLLAVSALLLTWASAASAQYVRSRGDTVRLREVTMSTTILTLPTGRMEIRSEHDANIGVSFGPSDSAQGWYESLRLALHTPQGTQAPATGDALRRPFLLRFDDRGRIETLRSPSFPTSFEGITDLSYQFEDLFPRLPATPLGPGVSWADTVIRETNNPNGTRRRATREIRSRVVRDTIVAGERAWVIATIQTLKRSSSQPVKGQPLVAHTTMSGADTGTFFFSRATRGLLGRQRKGSMAGTLRYEGGPQPVVLPLQQAYENTVTRIP